MSVALTARRQDAPDVNPRAPRGMRFQALRINERRGFPPPDHHLDGHIAFASSHPEKERVTEGEHTIACTLLVPRDIPQSAPCVMSRNGSKIPELTHMLVARLSEIDDELKTLRMMG